MSIARYVNNFKHYLNKREKVLDDKVEESIITPLEEIEKKRKVHSFFLITWLASIIF